ncbi:MAG: 16S rRNA (cytosine(1402)-N(4))-methyltransferase RsmH [Candidatus Pacebacteria bacterium]|nr:16S rRNA (cytosine(1402)-N(4))-methyltransferase RsmH [Candidatus Paceibacterota bacterium]MBP9701311.1 16S rRNA (cytosine(1402)-N(4))-methyltransferase RsmH [Candidatus Paceibacterota bacterium]
MNEHTSLHIPVLLHESIDGLDIKSGDTVVDGTFGGGGHSKMILDQYEDVSLICVDLDEAAGERYKAIIGLNKRAMFVQANFKDVSGILAAARKQSVDKVLLDLGTSTFQLLTDTRGFSFQSDAPLSMAFSVAGSHTGFSAWDIVNEWSEESIADIIYAYGEDRSSRRIARAIVEARSQGSIDTASGLAAVILGAFPRRGRIHPATKTFQAFRIAVNDELAVLKEALDAWWQVLAPGGRIAVITFHSLEDRIVKQWMKAQTNERVITKKPIAPSREELLANPRSRSAKLRIIEKNTTLV